MIDLDEAAPYVAAVAVTPRVERPQSRAEPPAARRETDPMSRPLVIFGLGALARSTYATIRAAQTHPVAGFTVDAAYRSDDRFDGLPVVAFDEVDVRFPAGEP